MSNSETNVETKVDVVPKATSITSDGLICEYDPSLLEFPESPTKESVRWTPEEDEMLRAAVALYKGKNWKKISDCFGTKKTEVQCLQHWRNVLNPCVVKGKGSWTLEEDAKLQMLVEKYGKTKWSYIGKFLPGRIGKQCRERWHNHLNPDLMKKTWTEDEEKLIIEQRAKLGNRWAKIARMLPGRSDNDVKNRWYASLRKKVEGGEEDETVEKKSKKTKVNKKVKVLKEKVEKRRKKAAALEHQNEARRRKKASPIAVSEIPEGTENHLPPRKRARMINAQLITRTKESTPVRPQKVWDRPTIPGLETQNTIWTPESSATKEMNAAYLLAGLGAGFASPCGLLDNPFSSPVPSPSSKKAIFNRMKDEALAENSL